MLACSAYSILVNPHSSIKLYVAALVDLWERQKAMGMNNYPSPRTKAINSILRAIDHVRKCSSDTQF